MSFKARKHQWLLIIALTVFTFSSIHVAADEPNNIENLGACVYNKKTSLEKKGVDI